MNCFKEKHRIVAEPVFALKAIENDPLGHASKYSHSFPVSSSRQGAHKSCRPFLAGHAVKLAQHTGIVGVIIAIGIRNMWLVGGVSRGMDAGRST